MAIGTMPSRVDTERRSSQWALVVAGVAIGLRLVAAIHLGGASHSFDVSRFYQLGRAGGRPYVDYAVEYPPVTLLLLKAIALFGGGRRQCGYIMVWLNVLADVGIAGLLLWAWGPAAAVFYLVSALFLANLIDARADTVSTLIATFGVAAWVRRRPGAGGAAVGIAALTKLWPAPLAILGLGRRLHREGSTFVGAALVTMAVGGAVWLAVGGIHGVLEVLTYRNSHGWEVGTIPGVVLLALHHGGAYAQNGAYRIGTYSRLWRFLLWGTSVPLAAWSAYRGARANRLGLAWIGSVGALLVASALLSPQFVLWLLPAAAIAWVEGDRLIALVVGVCAPLTGIEMLHLSWLLEARPLWIALVGARDALLVLAVVLVVHALRRSAPATAPAYAHA